MNIGYSTGSLALGDFNKAIAMLNGTNANVIELSALREKELDTLINGLTKLNLNQFNFVSFHAPSKLIQLSEKELVSQLKRVLDFDLSIVLHPDVIQDISLWKELGRNLCIENMDKRKPIGRTTSDLEQIFYCLPEASFCLDLAHVRQVDKTMTEAIEMVKKLGNRLRQLHVSDVNSMSKHEPLNIEAIMSFRKIAPYINNEIPLVIESPVSCDGIKREMEMTSFIFDNYKFEEFLNNLSLAVSSYTGKIEMQVI